MPRTCTICTHKKRAEIDQALIGGESLRNIASRYGTTSGSLKRHKDKHLPESLTVARHAETVIQSSNLLDRIQYYLEMTDDILHAVNGEGDYPTAIKALKEVRGFLELLARARGELGTEGSVNVQVVLEQNNQLVEIFMEALRSELGPEESSRVVSYLEKRRQAIVTTGAASHIG